MLTWPKEVVNDNLNDCYKKIKNFIKKKKHPIIKIYSKTLLKNYWAKFSKIYIIWWDIYHWDILSLRFKSISN